MSNRLGCLVAGSLCLWFAGVALAVNPSPLENAYWRFEEGEAGQIVAATVPEAEGSVIDVTGNGNNMRRFGDVNAPVYTDDVPGSVVPANGEANNLALRFTAPYVDIYTDGKDINNPLVTALTIEASFKAEMVGGGPWRTIVSKESKAKVDDPQDCASPDNDCLSDAPPLALKIRGDDGRLMIQIRDKSNNLLDVNSLAPIQPLQWYHAVVVADTELKLYLNANDGNGYVLQGSQLITGGGPLWQGTADDYNTVWNIGKGMWARQINDWFDGVIDEVKLSNTALAPSDFLWFKTRPPGDVDGDFDVDTTDLSILQLCTTGPHVFYGTVLPAECTATFDDQGFLSADFDKDQDVDQSDFGMWQRCFTGDSQTPDPSCGG